MWCSRHSIICHTVNSVSKLLKPYGFALACAFWSTLKCHTFLDWHAESITCQVSSNGLTGIPVVIQFKSVTSLIVELGVNVLALKPVAPHLDPDLFYRAAILVPIVFNSLKVRGFQLSSSSMNFFALWDALLKTCEWCGDEKAFQRPGVPELAGLTLGIIEMSLGNNPEIWAAPDETERLHAMVMAHIMSLEHLVQTAAKSIVRSHIQLVRICLWNKFSTHLSVVIVCGSEICVLMKCRLMWQLWSTTTRSKLQGWVFGGRLPWSKLLWVWGRKE